MPVESTLLIASHLGFLVIGALMTGWMAWLFRTDAARTGVVREQTGRRLALIEEVSLQVSATQDLLERAVDAVVRGQTDNDEALRVRQQLAAALEDMPLAEARLRLLDEASLGKVLRLYTQKMTGVRRQLPGASQRSIDEDALRKALTEISALHEKLHESLARRYNRQG